MAILVTGGAGYIGSHTVWELIAKGYEVIVVDNLSTGFLQAIHNDAKCYNIDIHDEFALNRVFNNEHIEGVIHFAAFSQVGESMKDPLKYYYNNVSGTCTLLKCMKNNNVNHIIFSSTAAVYGVPQNEIITEQDMTCPINPYGETKLAIERMMSWAEHAYGIHYIALRYFNACGAHPSALIGEAHNPETHLIPLVLQVPNKQRNKISIFGDNYPTKDGTCVRDYVHVCDLAQAHILSLEYLKKTSNSDTFNLGNGEGFSVKQVLQIAEKVTKQPIAAEIVGPRPGDPAMLVASSQKAKKLLGWQPQYNNLEAIIETAWNWHRNHPVGYNN